MGPDAWFDARNLPVALVALFEGPGAGLLAGALVGTYRIWLGGIGAGPGLVVIASAALAGGLIHRWARRGGGVRSRHAIALGAAVFVATFLGHAMLGSRGLETFARTWPQLLAAYVGGIPLLATLFASVVERERLQAGERRFRAILDEASDAIRIVDGDTQRVLDANRADATLAGRPRETLLGEDARALWPPDEPARGRWEALQGDARRRGVASGFGLLYPRRAGEPLTVDVTARVAEHAGRRYEILVIRDAAEREALERARREVGELRAVTMLASAAAHEINNPLTVVVGSLELLRRRIPAGETEQGWMDRALAATGRIHEIIARMGRITKLEAAPTHAGVPEMLDVHRSSKEG